MISKILEKIYKISNDSNIYFLDFEKKILIDAGKSGFRQQIIKDLKNVVNLDDIDIVILTHLHYDHIGNIDLFKNAKIYASKESINDFKKDPSGCVLGFNEAETLKKYNLFTLPQTFFSLEIIHTPGHTRGSVCLYYGEEKILFSGDTLFDEGVTGRTDLPTSSSQDMVLSLKKLKNIDYKILCPGHDY